MAVNKVIYGNETLIDITDTTATAADVLAGTSFYLCDGTKAQGNLQLMTLQEFNTMYENIFGGEEE